MLDELEKKANSERNQRYKKKFKLSRSLVVQNELMLAWITI